MSRFLRTAAPAALALAGAMAFCSAASAQSYSRLVVFGDSLSDNGNLFAATFNTQPPSPIYFQGRFSNGPVFTELLGFTVGRSAAGASVTGSINYAYGGARTDSSAFPPGMRNQLLAYTGAGGTFRSTDLVSVLGGANNIFQGLPAAGASSNPTGAINPVALSAAADINFIVNSVATAGAGTIMVLNLPKLSTTPQFGGTPAAPLADFAVGSFNTALLNGLFVTAAARPNTNIIHVDLFKIGDVITANPGAFGLSNVTQACFNGVTVCANPNSFFYYDGVHPTAAGHALLASLATDYLYYGDAGAQSALMGETALRFREDMLDAAGEGLAGSEGWEAGTELVFGGLIDSVDMDARGLVPAAESEGQGFRIGLNWSPSSTWRFALAGSMRNAEVNSTRQWFDVESFGVDAAIGWRSGSTFASLTGGMARDSYEDFRRQTAMGPIVHTGATEGVSTGVRAQAGIWFGQEGSLAISPRLALAWSSSDVDGFFEQGAAAQYQYADRTVESTTAELGVRAEGNFGGMTFFVEGGWREELDDGSERVGTSLYGGPSQVLYREIEAPFGGHLVTSAGLEGDIGGAKVSFGYRGRYGENADSHMGAINVSIPLP
jgi:outer membrane lipase/esterase